jgi:hypothetical protein
MMVSYVRARADGLGLSAEPVSCNAGIRIVIHSVSAFICGIVSACIGGNQKLYLEAINFAVVEKLSPIFIYHLQE